jgi:4-hydroxyphenylpyruvate dioxygenase
MSDTTVPLQRIDHVRLVVGNARQSAYFYRNAFGFEVVGYAGLETRARSESGYVLRQGKITFVLASPLSSQHPDNARLVSHGDSVSTVAFEVPNVAQVYEQVLKRGAVGASEPRVLEDAHGTYESAEIEAYGDVRYAFVNRAGYRGVFAPGFEPIDPERYHPDSFRPVGLKVIDHIVANVEEGQMDAWVDWHARVLDFSLMATFDDKDISTEYSALMSKVVADGRGRIKLPINEPARGRRRSQIEEYLQFHNGPGVQHIAMATSDIIGSVRACVPTMSRFCACQALTTKSSANVSARSTKTPPTSPSSVCSSTATTKVTCCRSLRSLSMIAPPFFSRSSSATARAASARAISKRSLKRSNANKPYAARCDRATRVRWLPQRRASRLDVACP